MILLLDLAAESQTLCLKLGVIRIVSPRSQLIVDSDVVMYLVMLGNQQNCPLGHPKTKLRKSHIEVPR